MNKPFVTVEKCLPALMQHGLDLSMILGYGIILLSTILCIKVKKEFAFWVIPRMLTSFKNLSTNIESNFNKNICNRTCYN